MTDIDLDNTNDYELIMLYRENNEDAKNILYLKYKFIIDILIKKYLKLIHVLNIDMQEVYSECSVAFSDALNNFQEDKDATLPTFLTICIERRLLCLIKKYNREKYKVLNDTYSLDYYYEELGKPLMDVLTDNTNEPLGTITEEEEYNELIKEIKISLSKKENDVFSLMVSGFDYKQIAKILKETPKQVDNSIQRIKLKIKSILNERNIG